MVDYQDLNQNNQGNSLMSALDKMFLAVPSEGAMQINIDQRFNNMIGVLGANWAGNEGESHRYSRDDYYCVTVITLQNENKLVNIEDN